MNNKTRLLLLAALFVLALPLIFTGTASAAYMGDGAVQHATNGGWVTPNDMVCIKGVHTDGTLDLVAGVTNGRDCIYYNTGLTTMNPVDVTGSSVCGTTAAGPFNLACNTSANCKFTTPAAAATWNATDSKCYDSSPCVVPGAAGNDGAKHALATSICVDGSGNGISLKGLDRTYTMCLAKGGTWKQTSATAPYPGAVGTFPTPGFGGACVAYGRQFAGQNASGAPLTFGAKGTASTDAGYCYTTMNMTTAYGTAALCPSNKAIVPPFNANAAYDWAFSSSKCTYAKGIAGYINAALTKADGTLIAAGTYVDFSSGAGVGGSPINTMGDCLKLGASWNNWVGTAASTTSVATTPLTSTIPAWDYTKQAPDADTGCLHCHSSLTEYNGPAEREKDSYLKTGHKNMLRKVTNGKPWAGPDGVVYTTDGTNGPINFNDAGPYASVMVSGVKQNLYYVYGDWMILAPSLVYGTNGYGATIGSNNGYGCGACHTAGYSDSSLTCTVGPLINTTAALCTAAGGTLTAPAAPGVQSIGTVGYKGVEPQNSFPGIAFANNPQWNNDGITCGRCHNAAVAPLTAAQIAATPYTSTQALSGGMGALANGTGRTGLCFGCHQSLAKIMPANTTTTTDPTVIPTGVSHGAAYGRDFNGHVLGNSFLNSVHARYTGTTVPNALGKFDLMGLNGSGGTYSSLFKGYTCWQSPTSNSPAKTKDATSAEIEDKATCETLYGAGSWRADQDGSLAAASIQGTCTTCHDVHNSLFVASQAEAAIRKTCDDCHVNNATTGATDAAAPQMDMSVIRHLKSPGTPFDASKYESACVVCHMATQAEVNGNQNTMPAHIWRINTDVAYNTFPTSAQFYGGSCSVGTPGDIITPPQYTTSATCVAASGVWTPTPMNRNAGTAPDGAYTNAVWVDLDMACGQCHGGSLGSGKTVNGAPFLTKAQLATAATNIHSGGTAAGSANFFWIPDATTSYKVSFNGSSSVCPSGSTCSYTWDFGDTTTGAGPTTTHTYSGAGSFSVTLTVAATSPVFSASTTQTVAPTVVNVVPTVNRTGFNVVNMTASFTDASSDTAVAAACTNYYGNPCTSGASAPTVTVSWGDGVVETKALLSSFSHTYLSNASFVITQIVKGATGLEARYNDVSALATSSGDTRVTVPTSTTKYSISGTITSASLPVAGATVVLKLNGATKQVAITASDGTYSFAGLAGSTTYTVTASKYGYDWSTATGTQSLSLPVSVPVASANVTGVNFTPATSPATL